MGFLIISLAINFLKNSRLRIMLHSLTVAASSFVLVAGTQFMLENGAKRKLFDLETAVTFHKISFEEAQRKAKTENKMIFVDFYTAWCGPCLEFSRTVLTDPEVGEVMNKNFVSLKFDAEKGSGIALAKRYNVTSYPTLLVISQDGEVMEDIGNNLLPTRDVMIETADKYQKILSNTTR